MRNIFFDKLSNLFIFLVKRKNLCYNDNNECEKGENAMKIAISTESTSDVTKEMLEKYDVHILPYEILLGDKTFYDGELTTQEMFDYVDKTGTLPKTSAINEFRYTEYFEELKKDYDGVVHISLSSGITSSTNNAINAAKKVKNCYVVDSKSLSTGIALLAIYARKLADKGYDAKKIYEAVSERVPRLQVSFVVERLDYLYKGGRCSSLALLGANLLKIRPRIIVKNDDGKMVSDKKYRGKMEQVVEKYCADTLAEFNNPDKSVGFVTYTTATEGMAEAAKKAMRDAGFEQIYETKAGGTIASHCGANTLGILYINDGGREI